METDKRVICEQRILVNSNVAKETYITNQVAFYREEDDKTKGHPLSLPHSENLTRGVFFGTLAYAFYGKEITAPRPKESVKEFLEKLKKPLKK